jgi:hypothetical protein
MTETDLLAGFLLVICTTAAIAWLVWRDYH